jgi:hypothetical protein
MSIARPTPVKRPAVLLPALTAALLLATATAHAACPKALTGSYAGTLVEDNGNGTKEFGVITAVLGRDGTGTFTYGAFGEAGPGAGLAEGGVNNTPLTYTYVASGCRGELRFEDDFSPRTVFFVVGENGNRIMGIFSDPSQDVMQINQITLFKQ